MQTKKFKRSHFSLAEKLLLLHDRKIGTKPVDIQLKFKISPHTYYRILASKYKLRERDSTRGSTKSKGTIHPKHPQLKSLVTEISSYARENRMSVSKNLIKERALMTAEALPITGFQAPNGWLNHYLRRSPIQPAYKLRGKGDSSLPNNPAYTVTNLSEVSFHCGICNICNMDESGLFFRMGQNRSYLSVSESRS